MPRIHIPCLTKLHNPVQRYLSFCFIAFGEGSDDLDIRDIRVSCKDNIIRIIVHATPVMPKCVRQHKSVNKNKINNLLNLQPKN